MGDRSAEKNSTNYIGKLHSCRWNVSNFREEKYTSSSSARHFLRTVKMLIEDLARMYWDKYQIETACLRILSCKQVTSERVLSTYLSYNDLII